MPHQIYNHIKQSCEKNAQTVDWCLLKMPLRCVLRLEINERSTKKRYESKKKKLVKDFENSPLKFSGESI